MRALRVTDDGPSLGEVEPPEPRGELRPQGTLVLKSTFHGATPVDAARLVVEEITVIGSRCGRFAPALALLARHAIDPTPLVSEVMSLDRGEQTLERAGTPGILKVLLARD